MQRDQVIAVLQESRRELLQSAGVNILLDENLDWLMKASAASAAILTRLREMLAEQSATGTWNYQAC